MTWGVGVAALLVVDVVGVGSGRRRERENVRLEHDSAREAGLADRQCWVVGKVKVLTG